MPQKTRKTRYLGTGNHACHLRKAEFKDHVWCWDFIFDRWYAWACRSRLEPMKKIAKTLKGRLGNLLTYCRKPITNAVSESLNAKIQWIKYTARGFRSRAGFKTAILSHCGGLELQPTTHTNS